MGSREFCLPSAISSWIYIAMATQRLASSYQHAALILGRLPSLPTLSVSLCGLGHMINSFTLLLGLCSLYPGVGRNSGKLRNKDDFLFQGTDLVVVSGFFPFMFNPFILCTVDDRAVAHIWRPEVNLWESVLSVHHLGSRIKLRLSG